MYHTLNKLSVDVTRKILVGEAWCPVTSRQRVVEALRAVSENSNSTVRVPPSLGPVPARLRACLQASLSSQCCAPTITVLVSHQAAGFASAGGRHGHAAGDIREPADVLPHWKDHWPLPGVRYWRPCVLVLLQTI